MLYANYVRNKMRHLYKPIIAEAEGVPCVLEYSKGKYMKDYEIYGNSVQDGTPAPENPVEIQSVGDLVTDEASEHYGKYDIPITVAGKNLIPYPYSDSTKTLYGITFTDNNGVITLDGTTTLSETEVVDFRLMFNAKLEAGTYTLSGCPKTGATYTYRLFVNIKHDDNTNTYVNEIGNGSTFTVADTDLFTISIRIGGQLGTVSNLVFKPQLEKGSSATEYEPYRGIEKTHIYLDEPLRKVGGYSDYVDFKKQKVVRWIEVLDDTGTKSIYESLKVVSTPTEEPISLPTLQTFKGTTIMSVDTTVLPSNIKVTYIRT